MRGAVKIVIKDFKSVVWSYIWVNLQKLLTTFRSCHYGTYKAAWISCFSWLLLHDSVLSRVNTSSLTVFNRGTTTEHMLSQPIISQKLNQNQLCRNNKIICQGKRVQINPAEPYPTGWVSSNTGPSAQHLAVRTPRCLIHFNSQIHIRSASLQAQRNQISLLMALANLCCKLTF